MASTVSSSLVLFVTFNLLFFSLVTASPILGGSGGSSGSSGGATCPRDALKLGICAKLLGGLLGVTVGTPPVQPCCSLIAGLVDLEAAACLCTAIRANVLGINLNVPVSLSLLLNACGKRVPRGFQCA